MQYLMAVDLGTSFIKVGVYDMCGRCISVAQESVTAECVGTGSFIQCGEMLLEKVLACMRKSLQMHDNRMAQQIAAVSFTGQMAGFIGVDEKWNDITAWSCSLDTRYLSFAGKIAESYRGWAGEISGTCSPLMAPKIMWFQKDFPREAGKVSKYMMLSSYILGKLGNCSIEEAVIDDSLIGWTGLADIQKRTWSDEICRYFEIDQRLLPGIVSSDKICACLSREAAQKTGLLRGTPLIIGAGDKVAGCIGAGVTKTGDMIFEAASYGGFSCLVEECRQNPRRNYYDVICNGKGYLAHKYIPGSGMTLRWFLEQFSSGEDFSEMERKASEVEIGCQGMMAIGLLGGSAMPFDGQLKGMWMGFDWSHRPEHFYRALLESYAYDLALTIDSVEETYEELSTDRLVMTGGGAKSAFWAQMIADVTGKTVCRRRENDASLLGAVLIAKRGLGLEEGSAARQWGREEEQVIHAPDEAQGEIYQPLKKRYEAYRAGLHDFFVRL